MKYRKKPVVIEAIEFKNFKSSTIKNILEFMNQEVKDDFITQAKFYDYCSTVIDDGGIYINTLEGKIKASLGDYIIKGVKDEFYPCKPDIFRKTYEEVYE